jgi:hypothetical protein
MSTRDSSVSGSVEAADEVGLPGVRLVPKRYRWLKRLMILSGALVVGLVILRWWWGFEANRRLQAQIEQHRAAGQPVYASEFDAELDAVPDEENAALLLEEAINAVVSTTRSGVSVDDFQYEPKNVDQDTESARELIESNAEVLALARQARGRSQAAWSQRLTNLATTRNSALSSGQRMLAKLLWLSGAFHYRTGNHAEAIETLHDLLSFNEAMASHPTLISSFVGWACYELGISLLEDCIPGLSVHGTGPGQEAGVRPANRGQIDTLLESLLDEAEARGALVRSYFGERASSLDLLDSVDRLGSGVLLGKGAQQRPLWNRVTDLAQRPIFILDTIRAVGLVTLAMEAGAENNWPEAAKHFPPTDESRSLLRSLTRPLTHTPFGGAYDWRSRSIQIHFKHLARRRMAATALALRLFEIDRGHRPKTLTELVPDYLAAVPIDPFSPDDASIRYDPDAEYAVLYSVGANTRDDGGVITLRANRRIDRKHSDIPFYLDGRPEKEESTGSGASAKTGDDNENAQDDEGQGDEDQPRENKPQAW